MEVDRRERQLERDREKEKEERKMCPLLLVQSAYRLNYSTETAPTKVVCDIVIAADA